MPFFITLSTQRYKNLGNDLVMSLNVNNKYQTICDTTSNYDTAGQFNDKQYIRFTMRYTQGNVQVLKQNHFSLLCLLLQQNSVNLHIIYRSMLASPTDENTYLPWIHVSAVDSDQH